MQIDRHNYHILLRTILGYSLIYYSFEVLLAFASIFAIPIMYQLQISGIEILICAYGINIVARVLTAEIVFPHEGIPLTSQRAFSIIMSISPVISVIALSLLLSCLSTFIGIISWLVLDMPFRYSEELRVYLQILSPNYIVVFITAQFPGTMATYLYLQYRMRGAQHSY